MAAASEYSTIDDFEADFVLLYDTLNFVRDNVRKTSDAERGMTYGQWNEGRKLRVIYPNGSSQLAAVLDPSTGSGSQPWFVGFFGWQKKNVDRNVAADIWKLDDAMVSTMPENKKLMMYFSSETIPDKEWYNFVIFSGKQGLREWGNTPHHTAAVRDLSPRYYSHVRIHIGELYPTEANPFQPMQTIFLDYKQNKIHKRHLEVWKTRLSVSLAPSSEVKRK